MKIIINYDLIKKINAANGIIDYKKIITKNIRLSAIGWLIGTNSIRIMYGYKEVQPLPQIMAYLTYNAIIITLCLLVERLLRYSKANIAYEELVNLAVNMESLGLDTNAALLRDAILIETNYKIRFNHLKPNIEQNKYILIPSYNYKGDIKETSILQEHKMGSKDYVLSIGSKTKKAEKVLVGNYI